MPESARLADQIRRAYEGQAWHGDSLRQLLTGVKARQAAAHPIAGAHSIWELVLHITAWDAMIIKRASGMAARMSAKQNFPPVEDSSEAAWQATLQQLALTQQRLVATVAAFPDSRLDERVPGKIAGYHTFYYSFSGIAQHDLYHAGQIALLKKTPSR